MKNKFFVLFMLFLGGGIFFLQGCGRKKVKRSPSSKVAHIKPEKTEIAGALMDYIEIVDNNYDITTEPWGDDSAYNAFISIKIKGKKAVPDNMLNKKIPKIFLTMLDDKGKPVSNIQDFHLESYGVDQRLLELLKSGKGEDFIKFQVMTGSYNPERDAEFVKKFFASSTIEDEAEESKSDDKNQTENRSNNDSHNNKIDIKGIDYTFTKNFSVNNFSFTNSFIKQSVLKDGKDEIFLVFTFDIINNDEDAFEKRISIEKAKELDMSSDAFLIEQKYQSDEIVITPRLILGDINDIPGKNDYKILIFSLYDDNNQIIKFSSMNPMRKGKTYHGTGYMKFSNNIKTTDDINIDFIQQKEITFKPQLLIEVEGGTKSDFAKYHRKIIESNIDISNLKDLGLNAIKSKKNYISMNNKDWYLNDYKVLYKLLKLKEK